jgi:hypothetical protein
VDRKNRIRAAGQAVQVWPVVWPGRISKSRTGKSPPQILFSSSRPPFAQAFAIQVLSAARKNSGNVGPFLQALLQESLVSRPQAGGHPRIPLFSGYAKRLPQFIDSRWFWTRCADQKDDEHQFGERFMLL